MNINKKKENFVKNLKEFLLIYKHIIESNEYSSSERRNCGNQARQTAEAFCKAVIGEHIEVIGQGRGNLYQMIQKLKKREYSFNTYAKRNVIERLDRVRFIGNNASHNNQYKTSIYDLNELKNNLLYLSLVLLGKEETQEIEGMMFTSKKRNPLHYLLPIFLLSSTLLWWGLRVEKEQLTILSGDKGGTYTQISKDLSFNCKETFSPYGGLKVILTKGSHENFSKMLAKKGDFGWMQEDVLHFDKNKQRYPLTSLFSYQEEIHILIRKNSQIKHIEDLNGKRVIVGLKHSGSWVTAQRIQSLLHIKWKEKNWGTHEGIEKLKESKADAMIYVVGQPFSFLKDTHYNNITLLSFYSQKLEQDLYPKTIIKKENYPMLDEDIETHSVKAMLMAQKSLSLDTIESMKSCVEQNEYMLKSHHIGHSKFKEIHEIFPK